MLRGGALRWRMARQGGGGGDGHDSPVSQHRNAARVVAHRFSMRMSATAARREAAEQPAVEGIEGGHERSQRERGGGTGGAAAAPVADLGAGDVVADGEAAWGGDAARRRRSRRRRAAARRLGLTNGLAGMRPMMK
uniref:Uncharacterized protein n=2 Tax=Oryza sativa subsp. japonica TaxID=39947 RepID=Q6YW42_ORYSJ|nr:hypothetical protein [Oryza sativa Japonica Group]